MSANILKSKEGQWVVLGLVAIVVIYVIAKKSAAAVTAAAGAAADAAGGIISGNNALTAGTDYQGAGVLGTVGAAANDASGGFFDWLGSSIGGGIYDLTHPTTTVPDSTTAASTQAVNRDQIVTQNAPVDIDQTGVTYGAYDPTLGD